MNYILLGIIVFLIIYYLNSKSTFSETTQPLINNVNVNVVPDTPNVHKLDTRYEYPLVPPVNPMVYKTIIENNIPASPALYSNQDTLSNYTLEQPSIGDTNQLNYSGGTTQLIKIPLQYNEPYNEQLRTQEVLITPYNRIKYSNTNC
jgi:hypothetical protein